MPGTSMTKEMRSVLPAFWTHPFGMLRDEVQNLLSDFYGERGNGWQMGRLVPSIDLSETDGAIQVQMDIPGVKPEEIDIQLNQGVLTVSGQRKEVKEEKGRTFHRIERRSGSFSRSLTLPAPVKEEAVEAQYQDGILTITLQKTEAAKAHKIKVKPK